MLARTHLAFAILCAILVVPFVPAEDLIVFFALALFGALLPDIDHEGSTINRVFPVTRIVSVIFTHRGFFHSVFPIIILYAIFASAGYAAEGLYICFGYFTHLLSDAFTKLGVRFFHPVSDMHARGFIRVGGIHETLLFITLLCGTALLAYYSL